MNRPGGVIELRSAAQLPEPLDLPLERLRHWAKAAPDRVLVAERAGEDWRALTYGEAERRSARLAEALRPLGLGPDRPILLAGEPSCAQALLRLAALRAGIPFLPVSPGLLRFGGESRVRALLRRATPGLLALSPALEGAFPGNELPVLLLTDELVGEPSNLVMLRSAEGASRSTQDGPASFETPASRAPQDDERLSRLEALAAIFLTSGSTGEPKGVAVTHRMIAANQAAYGAVWPFLDAAPPVILDWLPWHHTFGGNDNLHKALWFGGSYYVDDGQPTPERFGRSLANVRSVRPTIHLNVPRGLALLAEALERDEALFASFFERLEAIFFAGAGLDRGLWDRLRRLTARAAERSGRETALVSGYGTTEAGSTICLLHFPAEGPRVVGLPIPGLTMRLVPEAEKLEVRVKGPTVTPGYWRNPDRTAAAFDADGFLRTGDAARFVDPAEPARGLVFDGRIGEDFKLATGTWVSVGPLRLALLAALPPGIRDLLVAGHDRDRLGLVLFPSPGTEDGPALRAAVARALGRHNRASPGSSTAIAAALLDPDPPGPGETSDKGTLNQRLALANRAGLVERLFADPPSPDLILPDPDAP